MGKLVAIKYPLSSEVAVLMAPVPPFVMVIAAPGMMAPVVSVTTPEICPSEVCGCTDVLKPITTTSVTANRVRNCRVILSPESVVKSAVPGHAYGEWRFGWKAATIEDPVAAALFSQKA